MKKKQGGKRKGAGRKALRVKPNRRTFKLSDDALQKVNYYSEKIGVNPSDLVDLLLCDALTDNNFIQCTHCGEVTAKEGLNQFGTACKCRHCGERFYM